MKGVEDNDHDLIKTGRAGLEFRVWEGLPVSVDYAGRNLVGEITKIFPYHAKVEFKDQYAGPRDGIVMPYWVMLPLNNHAFLSDQNIVNQKCKRYRRQPDWLIPTIPRNDQTDQVSKFLARVKRKKAKPPQLIGEVLESSFLEYMEFLSLSPLEQRHFWYNFDMESDDAVIETIDFPIDGCTTVSDHLVKLHDMVKKPSSRSPNVWFGPFSSVIPYNHRTNLHLAIFAKMSVFMLVVTNIPSNFQ